MNPSHRDGWPPPPGAGPGNPHQRDDQQQAHRPAAGFGSNTPNHPPQHSPHNAGGFPPPSGPPFVPYSQPAHSLAGLAGLNQSSPRHPAHNQPGPPPTTQGQGYSSAMSQQNMSSRDMQEAREREAREVHIKEEHDAVRRERERDLQRQHMDGPPHQNQAGPIHLHQPVAVGPRTALGPNGLLGNPGAIAGPNSHAQLGAPAGPGGVFNGGPVQPAAQQAQSMQPGLLVPFGPGGAQAAASVGQGQQPILNDALSYLDQVKVQFVDHPDVYNRFLDIMKDFKSGAIDTPGVIDRVSTLFAGNPDLIQGFNTFLPPGYRIECGTSDDPNAIRVTTPMGTTVQAMPQQRPLSPRGPPPPQEGNNGDGGVFGGGSRVANSGRWTPQPGQQQQQMMVSPGGRPVAQNFGQQQPGIAAAIEAQQREQRALVHQTELQGVSQLQNAISTAERQAAIMSPSGGPAMQVPGQQMEIGPDGQPMAPGMEKRGPVEFNHAISYVNKIKNRFATQPDIYKQFLEILQTYQRESKPIQDVYGQVTRLFHQAPDLLEDFKQFLPESAAHAKAAAAARQQAEDAVMLSNVRGEPFYTPGQGPQPHQTPRAEQRLPPVGNFAPTPAKTDNKRKRTGREGTVMSNVLAEASNAAGKVPAYGIQIGNVSKRAKQTQGAKQSLTLEGPPLSPTLVPALPEPLPPAQSSIATSEELGFFDRAKKTIGNKNAMNEFLKLCNLFSQDLIDRTTLVAKARSFIGSNPDLFKWFQDWIGYEDKDVIIENRPRAPSGRISLSNCRGLGPSYRLLPKRERLKPCRGRDELCNEVLNDDWASHPTWASEDSGFIAHRKNIHEEGLHKIEEERHDYDFNIEACSRTIQLLEPYAQQLLRMNQREKENMEIPAGLGGQSETIHKRIVMKLYGREKGQQVVAQLHKQPYAVIPVLVNRLKQKLEEWKQAQREWEKVWRDQTQKMFWKSLDHQAVNAKQADKRQFQTKILVGEIQTKYEEQKKRPYIPGLITKPQMKFGFEDTGVIMDASHLVLMFAEQMHSTDFPRLTSFIREFIPMFFGLDQEWFNAQIKGRFGDSPPNEMTDETMSAFDDPIGSKPRKMNGKNPNLLRGVLERGRKGRKDDGSATPMSRASTPDNASHADEDMSEAINTVDDIKSDADRDTWAQHPMAGNPYKNREVLLSDPYKRHIFNLYGNTSIYCFLRIFIFLYERLNNLKQSEADVHTTVKRAMAPKPAIELGILDRMPVDFFADIGPSANYYRQMLTMFEDFIKNDMEMSHIEETLRRYYLQTGWQLYSFDKLLSALVRFAIGMLGSEGKDKSWEILQLFKKDRAKEETSFQEELNYRKQVEKYTKETDIFKISYDQVSAELAIKIFKKDEPTFDVSTLEEEDIWRVYITNYTRLAPTPGVPRLPRPRGIIKRNLRAMGVPAVDTAEERSDEWRKRWDMSVTKEDNSFRISVSQLKLYFQPLGEEYHYLPLNVRDAGKEGVDEADAAARHREENVQDNFIINNNGMKGLSKEDVEGKNEGFKKIVLEGGVVVGGERDQDSEMEDRPY